MKTKVDWPTHKAKARERKRTRKHKARAAQARVVANERQGF